MGGYRIGVASHKEIWAKELLRSWQFSQVTPLCTPDWKESKTIVYLYNIFALQTAAIFTRKKQRITLLTRNLCSHIDLQTHASSSFDNCVTLTFDLLTSGSMHVERLPCLPSLVLIAQRVFLLEHGHIHTHMAQITLPTDWL